MYSLSYIAVTFWFPENVIYHRSNKINEKNCVAFNNDEVKILKSYFASGI